LQQRVREELVRRIFPRRQRVPIFNAVESFQGWAGKLLDEVGPDRTTGICLEERKLAKTTVETHTSALRLLYIRVLSGAR
jgi:hypothetical protein